MFRRDHVSYRRRIAVLGLSPESETAKARIVGARLAAMRALLPQRVGFQAEFDAGRAGGEASNPPPRQSAEAAATAMRERLAKP